MYTVKLNGVTYRTDLTARGAMIALRSIRWAKSVGNATARGWYEILFDGTVIAEGLV